MSTMEMERIEKKSPQRRCGKCRNRKLRFFLLEVDVTGNLLFGNRPVSLLAFNKEQERNAAALELLKEGKRHYRAAAHDRLQHRETGLFVSVFRAH